MKKVTNKKGFTLAELLIVVAIIAVLVAIAIPVFGGALEKARISADAANIRAGYAVAVNTVLTADPEPADGTVYYLHKDGTVGATGTDFATSGAPTTAVSIAGQDLTWAANKGVTYTYVKATGVFTIAFV